MRTLVLLALLPLAACEGDFTYNVDSGTPDAAGNDIQSEVRAFLESDGVEVASVACEETSSTPSAERGAVIATHTCTVEQPVGESFVVDAETVVDAEPDGTPMLSWSGTARNVLIVPDLEGRMSARFSEDSGQPLLVTCDTPRVLPSTPGDTFGCTLAGGETERPIMITITNETGGIDYEIGG